jgi:hypothetical protein
MKSARFPIAGLMAVVAAIAINLTVMRSFDPHKLDALPRHADVDHPRPGRVVLDTEPSPWRRLLVVCPRLRGLRLGGDLRVRHALLDRPVGTSDLHRMDRSTDTPRLRSTIRACPGLGSTRRRARNRGRSVFAARVGHRAARRIAGSKGGADAPLRALERGETGRLCGRNAERLRRHQSVATQMAIIALIERHWRTHSGRAATSRKHAPARLTFIDANPRFA